MLPITKVMFFVLCLLFGLSVPAADLNLIVEHELIDGKVFIKGITNLPPRTKLGVTLSSKIGGYSAQDYDIFVESDGSFISKDFTNKTLPLFGNYTAEIVTYLNGAWHNKSTLAELGKYSGKGIESGKMLVIYDFSVGTDSNGNAKNLSQEKNLRYEDLVKDFCYALQATMVCKDLNMRIDTETKIEYKVGMKIRGPESPYNQACVKGLSLAFDDEKRGICSKAWKKFGCYGTTIPRLIQENPFRKSDGIFCKF